jgi:ABC-type transporter Mla MlaB component
MTSQHSVWTGQLTAPEVSKRRLEFSAMPVTDWPLEIDLAGITRGDSSALALLLELKASSLSAQQSLQFKNPPHSLLTLAKLGGVAALLGWSTPHQPEGINP